MKNPFVYFDLGNVLVHFDHQVAVNQLATLSSRPRDRVQAALFDSGLQDQYESGRMDDATYAQQINLRLETELETGDILEAISAIFTPNLSMVEILRDLRQRQIPMAILSNTCDAHWQWILRQDWPITGDWFEFAVLSYEVGSMKPGPQIYEHCEQRAARASSELFFADDRRENVIAAQTRGWETHHFHGVEPLALHLQQWLAGG